MKVEALLPLNHNDKTIVVGEIIELDDDVAKKLIEGEAVKEVKEVIASIAGTNTKLLENKLN